jgi:hypothetical protein
MTRKRERERERERERQRARKEKILNCMVMISGMKGYYRYGVN